MLEELLQAALRTVLSQVGVDVVDVLNCGSESSPFWLILREPLLLNIFLWFDAPLFQIVNQNIHWDCFSHPYKSRNTVTDSFTGQPTRIAMDKSNLHCKRHIFTKSSAEVAGANVHIVDMGPQQVGDFRWWQVDRARTEVLSVQLASLFWAIGWHPFKTTQGMVEGRLGAFDWLPITVDHLSCEVLRVAMSERKRQRKRLFEMFSTHFYSGLKTPHVTDYPTWHH